MSPRGEERKAAIIEAAIARLVTLGVEGLRVRDVAVDVGINNATLHHHFPTKAALIKALVERFVEDRKESGGVPPQESNKGGSIEAWLAAYVANRRVEMRAAPEQFVVFNELMVLARRDAEVRRLMAEMQAEWQAYLAGICRAAGDDPETADARAARCRRELLGAGLELGLEG